MTKQIRKKDITRHFLLNLLTILSFEIEDTKMAKIKKKKIHDLVRMASTLVAYEPLFLDKKPEVFIQKNISLNEILEIINAINEKKFKQRKILLTPLEVKVSIDADRNHIIEALRIIIEELTEHVSYLEYEYDKTTKILSILNDSNIQYKKINEPLSQCLRVKDTNHRLLSFYLAVAILRAHKVSTKIKKDRIEFNLSKIVSKSSANRT